MPGPAYHVGRDNGTGPLGLLHDLLDQGMVAAKTVAMWEGQYRNHDFSGRVYREDMGMRRAARVEGRPPLLVGESTC